MAPCNDVGGALTAPEDYNDDNDNNGATMQKATNMDDATGDASVQGVFLRRFASLALLLLHLPPEHIKHDCGNYILHCGRNREARLCREGTDMYPSRHRYAIRCVAM